MTTEIHRSKPIAERNYDAFLSHAHLDKATVVNDIYTWCRDHAGMKVWYDSDKLHSGNISPQLGQAIADSQAGILVLTKASVERGYVEDEASHFTRQRSQFKDFQIVLLQTEACEVPEYLQSLFRLDVSDTGFNAEAAVKLISALHKHHSSPDSLKRPPIYMARGSRPSEIDKANAVAAAMRSAGFRILRDFPQQEMDDERLRRIMKGCVGMVALVPHRPTEPIITSEGILDEIRIAIDESIPIWLIVDQGLDPSLLPTGLTSSPPIVSLSDKDLADRTKLVAGAEKFRSDLRRQGIRKPAHCFLGHVFRGAQSRSIYELARRCVESVAGIPCYSGDELYGSIMLPEIMRRIAEAEFCIFDISDETGGFALSTCIEAGIAMGAAQVAATDRSQLLRDIHIISRGPRRDPPFMFGAMQVAYYENELELMGLLRKLCLNYRRIAE
jgi:hypothetical protein